MKIAITGRPGIGKTTLVKKLLEHLGGNITGFFTEEIRKDGKRYGFRIVRSDKRKAILASVDISSPFKVSRYRVDVRTFEEFVFPFIEDGLKKGSIVIVDEIGKMELFSGKFRSFVRRLIDSDVNCVVTIPAKDVHPLVSEVRRKFTVFKLTAENRDFIFSEILKTLKGSEDGGKQEAGSR